MHPKLKENEHIPLINQKLDNQNLSKKENVQTSDFIDLVRTDNDIPYIPHIRLSYVTAPRVSNESVHINGQKKRGKNTLSPYI